MQERIEQLRTYLEEGMWKEEHATLPWFKRLWLKQVQLIYLAAQEIKREKLLLRAHALTYTSLLSVIPLLALMAVAFRGLGGMAMLEKQLKPWLLQTFVPQTGNQVYGYINNMLENVSFQSLGAIGLLGFLYTAISALQRIEQSFNEVMHATHTRRFFIRIALYWSIITLGPLLLGISFSLQARLGQIVSKQTALSWISSGWLFGTIFSILLTCVAFWMLYQFVPARVVRIPSALYGALTMGIAWEVLKRTYFISLSGSFKLNKVYGTLAVLPMTLVWLYITWLLVLLGAVLTYVHQHHHQFVQARQQLQLSIRATEQLCCHLLMEIARRFRAGDPPATTEELIHLTQVGAAPIDDALERLAKGGFLLKISREGHKDPLGFVPGRDLQTIAIRDVLHHVRTHGDPLNPPLFHNIHPVLRPLLQRSEELRYEELQNLTLSTLLQLEEDAEDSLLIDPPDAPVLLTMGQKKSEAKSADKEGVDKESKPMPVPPLTPVNEPGGDIK